VLRSFGAEELWRTGWTSLPVPGGTHNEEILNCGHQGIKRFFALDHQTYEPGVLDTKTKELLGLVASAVLRCDDCITYHLVKAGEAGWTARK
jgi:AhpD family alkylhydroperoxidase